MYWGQTILYHLYHIAILFKNCINFLIQWFCRAGVTVDWWTKMILCWTAFIEDLECQMLLKHACVTAVLLAGVGGRTSQGTRAGRPWDWSSAWLNTDSDKGCQPTGQANGLLTGRCGLNAAGTEHVATHKHGAHGTAAHGAKVCVCSLLHYILIEYFNIVL